METIYKKIKSCQNDRHEFEWNDWSTSMYLQGFWICKKCGTIRYNWQHWKDGYFQQILSNQRSQ